MRPEQEKKEYQGKIKKIAKLLGYNVVFKEDRFSYGYSWLRKNGKEFHIVGGDYNWSPKGKFNICASYPGAKDNSHSYNEKRLEINLSCSKTPEQIARDIERRFFPTFEIEHQKAFDFANTTNERLDKKEANINKVAMILKQKPYGTGYDKRVTAYEVLGEEISLSVESYGDKLKIELSGITVEQFEKIFTALKGE